jgi:hypothetical protein
MERLYSVKEGGKFMLKSRVTMLALCASLLTIAINPTVSLAQARAVS